MSHVKSILRNFASSTKFDAISGNTLLEKAFNYISKKVELAKRVTKPSSVESPSALDCEIKVWLDGIKSGYSERFASAFTEFGVEDLQDIRNLLDDDWQEIESQLERLGAKAMQLRQIQRAIDALHQYNERVATRSSNSSKQIGYMLELFEKRVAKLKTAFDQVRNMYAEEEDMLWRERDANEVATLFFDPGFDKTLQTLFICIPFDPGTPLSKYQKGYLLKQKPESLHEDFLSEMFATNKEALWGEIKDEMRFNENHSDITGSLGLDLDDLDKEFEEMEDNELLQKFKQQVCVIAIYLSKFDLLDLSTLKKESPVTTMQKLNEEEYMALNVSDSEYYE